MIIVVAALVEVLTGLTLMTFPGAFVRLVYGADPSGVVITLGRMTGCGLLALGVACWPERGARVSLPALQGLLTYNVLFIALFTYLAISHVRAGLLFWPALALHGVLTILLVRVWMNVRV